MFSQVYYLLRAKKDGKYLVAHQTNQAGKKQSYLLIFTQDFEALSYLNNHAPEYVKEFCLESASHQQLKLIIARWGFSGLAMVEDSLIPQVNFLSSDTL
jgi:hypothetical protein